ncbi:MAG: DUF4126 domain-containing protein [Candidatus Eremiobacteraeota bacterium]|nr:DUF4126 domain-containing protein [Candidatus Eremiobacteraeota bacterium]
MDATTQYALAYALSASAGLRALLTMALASLAVHAGLFHPPPGFAWLGSTPVTVALFSVALLEFLGDKIPGLDHALHFLQVVVKPAAAAVLVGGAIHAHSGPELYGLMALGALNALGIHAASATVRGASSVFSLGVANPFVSIFEDVTAVCMVVLSFLAPLVAAAVAIVISVMIFRYGRRILAHSQ